LYLYNRTPPQSLSPRLGLARVGPGGPSRDALSRSVQQINLKKLNLDYK